MQWIGALITAVKDAGPPIYAAVLVASLLLLFLPSHIIAQLGLNEFVKSYRMYMGVALIASASLLSVHLFLGFARFISTLFDAWRLNRLGRKTLAELTTAEKAFLRPFILSGKNTLYAEISDGTAQGLQAKKLIFRASNVGTPGMRFAYNLQPYVRRLLNNHPELLD